jgi:hypothetical protein
MKRVWTILCAVIASLATGLLGAYVLRHFETTAGLVVGVTLVVLAIGTALPIPLHNGAAWFKENVVLVVPVIVDALKGESRKTDPPAPPANPDPNTPPSREG